MGRNHALRLRIRLFPRPRLWYVDLQFLPLAVTLDGYDDLRAHREHRRLRRSERFVAYREQDIGGQEDSLMSRPSLVNISNHPAFAGLRLGFNAGRADCKPCGDPADRFVKEPGVAGAEHSYDRVNARFKCLGFGKIQNFLSAVTRNFGPVRPAKLRVEIELCDLAAGLIVNAPAGCASTLADLNDTVLAPCPITRRPSQ